MPAFIFVKTCVEAQGKVLHFNLKKILQITIYDSMNIYKGLKLTMQTAFVPNEKKF